MGKTITGSVGQGGINSSKDTMTIQYLLNCVPANKGGPMTELEVDGIVGPKTIAAIKNFQKANFPFSDGRVDAGKTTFQALQKFDPNPAAPLMEGASKKGTGGPSGPTGAKFAGAGAAGKTSAAGASAKGGGAGGAAGGAAGAGAGAGSAAAQVSSKSAGGAGGGAGGGAAGVAGKSAGGSVGGKSAKGV